MEIKTPAFKNKDFIPDKYTCEDENINPLIEFSDIPEGAKSLALIIDDPDAPTKFNWVHWSVWNIEPNSKYIYEDSFPLGALQGLNSSGYVRYDGPCPPKGDNPHRYFFKAYALDVKLDLPEGSSREELEKIMKNHIIEEAEIIGLYQRK
ncbi:MAG: YbhB/YbcL family Raf kinase inhibitor-like protein [Candidatus Paceibacterota bacterium]